MTATRTGMLRGREGAVLTRGYISGGPEMLAALNRLEAGLKDQLLAQATQAGADVLAEAWRDRVPVKDGNYKRGIYASAKPGKRGATGLVRVQGVPGLKRIDQPYRYASRLEFGSSAFTKTDAPNVSYNLDPSKIKVSAHKGWRGRAAQPSLRPAFDAVKGQMLDAMSDEIRRLIDKATP